MKAKDGFTLIELVIVTLVVTALSGFMVHLVAAGFNSWVMVAERRQLVEQSRATMNRMVRTLQGDLARGRHHSVDSWIASFPPTNSEITFCRVSIDGNGYDPWDTLNSVSYTFDYPAKNIVYWQYDGATWLAWNLETVLSTTASLSSFHYFDNGDVEAEIPASSGLTDAQMSTVRTIELDITNQLPGRTFMTKTRVFPRNEGKPSP